MIEATKVVPGKIGIVTVTYNSMGVLKEFFDSVAAQNYRCFVLYIVDNQSKDETLAMCRERSDLPIRLITNDKNLGVAEGNNQGIRAALGDGCECVLLLNNDTVFPPDLLEILYRGLGEFHCRLTTPKIYYHDRPDVLWCAGGKFTLLSPHHTRHLGVDQTDRGQFDDPVSVTYTPTCCLLIHRSVFEDIGLMDSRYFVYSDDADFLYRCYKHGIQVWYVPKAKLWHKVSSLTGGESNFSLHYSTRNRVYFLRKHLPYGVAFMLYLQSQLRSTLALICGRISRSAWTIRCKANKEGWLMGSTPADDSTVAGHLLS